MNFREALGRAFPNKETPQQHPMSGVIYIAATVRENDEACKLLVSTVKRCGHQNRICLACAAIWGWDHQLHFDRTVRGRQFARELAALGFDPDEVAHGRGESPAHAGGDAQ